MAGAAGVVRLRYGLAGSVLACCLLGCDAHETAAVVYDLEGRPANPLAAGEGQVRVLVFARSDCPISNRYAPDIGRLHEKYAGSGVRFTLVYPDPDQTAAGIRQHLRDFDYPCQAVHDPAHVLVQAAGATITPEAAVFDETGKLVYRGRVDDRYVDFNKARQQPTTRDLDQAIAATLEGRATTRTTEAIGCYIADLK